MSTSDLTAEKIAQQFGLGSEHGQYAWRVMLNSPLDAERCQGIIATIAREDVIPHRRKPTAEEEEEGEPFPKVDPTASLVRESPSPIIADFAQTHGTALLNACLSHLHEPPYVAFSPQARPLFALLKEVSHLDVYSGLLSEGGVGKKVYGAFLRAVGRLVGDGGWVGGVGCVVELDEDAKYTNFGASAPLDVLAILLLILPILLNTIAALGPEGIPVQHPKSAENVRGVLKVSIDGLRRLGRERLEVVWCDGDGGASGRGSGSGEGTKVGDEVALVWEGLGRVRESIRV